MAAHCGKGQDATTTVVDNIQPDRSQISKFVACLETAGWNKYKANTTRLKPAAGCQELFHKEDVAQVGRVHQRGPSTHILLVQIQDEVV